VFTLFWFTGGVAAVLAAHTVWCMTRREAPEARGRFATVPTTSPVVSELEPSPEEESPAAEEKGESGEA
jgi:hypothetical protein